MPTISNQKKEKISEQILLHLYSIFPKQIFTSEIAEELARDEEFIKKLQDEMKKGKRPGEQFSDYYDQTVMEVEME